MLLGGQPWTASSMGPEGPRLRGDTQGQVRRQKKQCMWEQETLMCLALSHLRNNGAIKMEHTSEAEGAQTQRGSQQKGSASRRMHGAEPH